MVKANHSRPFWITNITKKDVMLTDLGLIVPANKSMNLLDKRHHPYTQEQLIASATSGSLFNKKSEVRIRKIPPDTTPVAKFEMVENSVVPSRRRSAVKVEEVYYEELEISDEAYAEQVADFTD